MAVECFPGTVIVRSMLNYFALGWISLGCIILAALLSGLDRPTPKARLMCAMLSAVWPLAIIYILCGFLLIKHQEWAQLSVPPRKREGDIERDKTR